MVVFWRAWSCRWAWLRRLLKMRRRRLSRLPMPQRNRRRLMLPSPAAIWAVLARAGRAVSALVVAVLARAGRAVSALVVVDLARAGPAASALVDLGQGVWIWAAMMPVARISWTRPKRTALMTTAQTLVVATSPACRTAEAGVAGKARAKAVAAAAAEATIGINLRTSSRAAAGEEEEVRVVALADVMSPDRALL